MSYENPRGLSTRLEWIDRPVPPKKLLLGLRQIPTYDPTPFDFCTETRSRRVSHCYTISHHTEKTPLLKHVSQKVHRKCNDGRKHFVESPAHKVSYDQILSFWRDLLFQVQTVGPEPQGLCYWLNWTYCNGTGRVGGVEDKQSRRGRRNHVGKR